MIRFACSRAGHAARATCCSARRAWRSRRSAGASARAPYFDNQVCFLELDGRSARLRLQKTALRAEGTEDEGYGLETVFERPLT